MWRVAYTTKWRNTADLFAMRFRCADVQIQAVTAALRRRVRYEFHEL
jgi:hypothetical protein